MSVTSIRVTPELLAALHAATPPGGSLGATIERLLDKAGGPEAVREEADVRDRRARAVANGRRLRARGARGVTLEEGFQEALAESAMKWTRTQDEAGVRRLTQPSRTLWWSKGPHEREPWKPGEVRIKRGMP